MGLGGARAAVSTGQVPSHVFVVSVVSSVSHSVQLSKGDSETRNGGSQDLADYAQGAVPTGQAPSNFYPLL